MSSWQYRVFAGVMLGAFLLSQEFPDGYKPPLRFHVLTPLYDTVVGVTTRDESLKGRIVEAVRRSLAATNSPTASTSLLDIGCGTGTLLSRIVVEFPKARVACLDADRPALEIAREKLLAGGKVGSIMIAATDSAPCTVADRVCLRHGDCTALPFADGSFDVVTNTLMLHHLRTTDKRTTLSEAHRTLAVGGRFLLSDWCTPLDPIQRGLYFLLQMFDGFDTTQDNVDGLIPEMMIDAGFNVLKTESYRTVLGTMCVWEAEP